MYDKRKELNRNEEVALQDLQNHLTNWPEDFRLFKVFGKGGYSSAGRALAWHARGRRFDPA